MQVNMGGGYVPHVDGINIFVSNIQIILITYRYPPPYTHTTIFFHVLEDSVKGFGSSPCGALPSVICTQLTGSCIINYSCI